jgi:hypothetical protein
MRHFLRTYVLDSSVCRISGTHWGRVLIALIPGDFGVCQIPVNRRAITPDWLRIDENRWGGVNVSSRGYKRLDGRTALFCTSVCTGMSVWRDSNKCSIWCEYVSVVSRCE